MRTPLIALFMLTACTDFPELDQTRSPDVASAPYPTLVPMDQLLKATDPRAELEEIDQLQARAEALRSRGGSVLGEQPATTDRVAALRARAEALRAIE